MADAQDDVRRELVWDQRAQDTVLLAIEEHRNAMHAVCVAILSENDDEPPRW